MSRECAACGKKTTFGNSIIRRGVAKYKGGIGLNTTGISRRRFRPNLQKVRVMDKNGSVKRLRICAKCLRSGKVRKPLSRVIPEGLRQRMKAKLEQKSPEARKRAKAKAGDRRRKRRAEEKARMEAKAKG